jgi:hypothetical protein
MKLLTLILFLCLLASCGSTGSKSNSGAEAPGTDIYQVLENVSCPNEDDFRGTGIGSNESEALAQARSNMALEHFSQKLKSNIQIGGRNVDGVASTSTRTNIKQETILPNAQDAKMQFSTRQDNKSGVVACMNRTEAAKTYIRNINSIFSFAEKEFSIAEQLTEQGKKKAALDKIYAIEDSLKNISYWNFLLQVVKSDNSYMIKEKDFWQKANSMKMQLKEGTTIYLDISGDNVLNELSAQIQEKGCNCTIVEKKENADYLIAIKTKLSRCNEAGRGLVFCYANATIVVNNSKYEKPVNVNIPEIKGSWTDGNKDKAIEETFKEQINSLAEKIIQTMNQ